MSTASNNGIGRSGTGRWKKIIHPTGQSLISGIFSESVTGVPIPSGVSELVCDLVGGGSGGAGGGSHANNAAGGGGGGSGAGYINTLIGIPTDAVTMDISIGAGGAGGAAGASGGNGGNTSLIFRNAAGTALKTLVAAANLNGPTAGATGATGNAANGGNGGNGGGNMVSAVTGTSGSGGNSSSSVLQRGWGSLIGCSGAAGGGVSSGNVGANGGTVGIGIGLFLASAGTSISAAGTYGSGGYGSPSPLLRNTPDLSAGGAPVAGSVGGAGQSAGATEFGAGGGGGAGGTTGGAGGNGAAGCVILRYQE